MIVQHQVYLLAFHSIDQQHPAAPCMCTPMLLQCVFLLDALIDSSPQDVRQGRHPASHKIYMGGASNQLTNGCWSIGLDTSTSIQVCPTSSWIDWCQKTMTKMPLPLSHPVSDCMMRYDEYDGLPRSRVCHTKTFSQTLLRVGFTLGVAKVLTDFRANALCLRKATKIICHYKILEGLYRCSIMLLLACRKGQALTSNSRPSKSDPDWSCCLYVLDALIDSSPQDVRRAATQQPDS
jgi:hypothetical protein